ncbi:tyrosine-type recombinase/integrase [Nonomuraea sp. NPDC005692]|uniref:tyrosine-type recombinase/integrase n=1 Tax=Nonomuraea sp. NPDC005692 TaxID=3157168 RepID=UPI0033D06C8E
MGDLLLQRATAAASTAGGSRPRYAARATDLYMAKPTPHILRAPAAILPLAMGVPVEKVQALLGHTSPVTAQRYDRPRS